jgi:hypothetical protein
MRRFQHILLLAVLATSLTTTAQSATVMLGSFAALRVAITGKPHTCIATAMSDSVARVYCELGSRQRTWRATYAAPMSWVAAHFDEEEKGIWLSGGYAATGSLELTGQQ